MGQKIRRRDKRSDEGKEKRRRRALSHHLVLLKGNGREKKERQHHRREGEKKKSQRETLACAQKRDLRGVQRRLRKVGRVSEKATPKKRPRRDSSRLRATRLISPPNRILQFRTCRYLLFYFMNSSLFFSFSVQGPKFNLNLLSLSS